MKRYFGDLFFTTRFFVLWGTLAFLFIVSFFTPEISFFNQLYTWTLLCFCLMDFAILFLTKSNVIATRKLDGRMSNGDANEIFIVIKSSFSIKIEAQLIDELPQQFQVRNFLVKFVLAPNEIKNHVYKLTPKERGEYDFGDIHIFIVSMLGLIQRRCTSNQARSVKVYPSFLQLRKHHILLSTDKRAQGGTNRLHKLGMSAEFDHVKEYTRGDDSRTINWKASARRNDLMVNSYMDEKSKQVYCLIDKGRLMHMPLNGLSLLDYSINAALMFSFTALHKDDKVGLLTFAEKPDDFLQAVKNRRQFIQINEVLYKQQSKFLESDYAAVYRILNQRAGQRSFLMLFTNFETLQGFDRQLPYLRMLNQKHLLCVIMFENVELKQIHSQRGDNLEDIYIKTIADKFAFEKKRILREMKKNGMMAIYTDPQQLSAQVVNKYLEVKRRQGI